jgi:hypothetical protein
MDAPALLPLAARLTKAQLKNSIADVLGVTVDAAKLAELPADFINETGFETAVEGQALSFNHVLAFSSIAWSVAQQLDVAQSAQAVAQCADTAAACTSKLVPALGLKLFRRPLAASELQRFEALATSLVAIPGASFEQVYRGLVSAMLQSPQFLYKLEGETVGTAGMSRLTTGYELASRLSFYLWQSAPDDQLLAFAAQVDAAGGVIDQAALGAQVTRMAADPVRLARARETFWGDYTHASTASFQEAGAELGPELRQSVLATFNRLSGEGAPEAPLQSMFTATNMMLTPKVAELLGAPSMGEGLQAYDTSAMPQRAGLLTHPGFIAAVGSTSFVGRGLILTGRVLCRGVTTPPPGIEAEIKMAMAGTAGLTPKGASEFRFGLGGACVACHKTFEPVAYAFERFDINGKYAETDNMMRPLYTQGYLQDGGGGVIGEYQGVPELMALLAASEETSKCFVSNMFEFASGRKPASSTDVAAVNAAHTTFSTEGGAFSHLLRSVALSPALQGIKVLAPAQ